RMSGVDLEGSSIRKGAIDAVLAHVAAVSGTAVRGGAAQALHAGADAEIVRETQALAERVAKTGGTPLGVTRDGRLLGVIHLKDVVKGGIRGRFAELRRMGIRPVMITGANPMTPAAIAAEAGRDHRQAEAKAEANLTPH